MALKILYVVTRVIYWCGSAVLVYALMQLVHGYQAKDAAVKKKGWIALAAAAAMVGLNPLLRLLGVF